MKEKKIEEPLATRTEYNNTEYNTEYTEYMRLQHIALCHVYVCFETTKCFLIRRTHFLPI